MQRNNTPAISPSEWRWVIVFSGLLVAITLLPYAWAFASDAPNDNWQFMGILTNPIDGASYLAKINQGVGGSWLFHLPYTSEDHPGAALHEFYLFLGHIAKLTGLSALLMFHVARLVTGFAMYISIYYLGAVIWPRLRPRRLFFSLLAVGSGLGWLVLVLFWRQMGGLNANALPTDLAIPESIPFYATYINPHFPLAIALIALLASVFTIVFRPGFDQLPAFGNGGISVVIITMMLAVVQPQGLPPITLTLCVYVVVLTLRTRRIPLREINWVLLVILSELPFLIYYLAVAQNNVAIQIWNQQNITLSPSPILFVIGYGLLLLVAIPAVWRALRYFERDGDRFMVIWLAVNVLLLYAPTNLQRRFSIALIIPIVYFAVRALEDYWFHRILPPWRDAMLVALFVFIIPSNILAISIPVFGILNPGEGIKNLQLIYSDQFEAIEWMAAHGNRDDVVLAPPALSPWIPPYSNLRVIYGHPFETLLATEKFDEVAAWYDGQDCKTVIDKYHPRYVVTEYSASPQHDPATTVSNCFQTLSTPVATFNSIQVYEIP